MVVVFTYTHVISNYHCKV